MTLTRLSALAAAALLATGAQAQNLAIAFADPISSVDPQLNNHAGDRSLALHFWDSIINSRDGGKLEPALASRLDTLFADAYKQLLAERHPHITRWQQSRGMDEGARQAFLDRECGADAEAVCPRLDPLAKV